MIAMLRTSLYIYISEQAFYILRVYGEIIDIFFTKVGPECHSLSSFPCIFCLGLGDGEDIQFYFIDVKWWTTRFCPRLKLKL